jgi:hypothetical protein
VTAPSSFSDRPVSLGLRLLEENVLIYEGHDVHRKTGLDPKALDQPMTTPLGGLTENGKFYRAAKDAAAGRRKPERVKVYEKIQRGVWSDKGFFDLVDAEIVERKGRRVLDFFLRPVQERFLLAGVELPATREMCSLRLAEESPLRPRLAILQGWQQPDRRERPASCATHNLRKSAKIEAWLPLVAGLAAWKGST